MVAKTERRLLQRLERVERLHRGATTPGEAEAARQAAERLRKRIGELIEPRTRFVREHVESLGVPAPPPPPAARMPSATTFTRVLWRWEHGDWTREHVRRWAARVVDRVVLPAEPRDPASWRAEVLLQLASLHRVQLGVRDIPAIRAFLAAGDWAAWFTHVAGVAHR